MLQVIVLVAGFLLILAVSWPSLRPPRTHGFYRFYAWIGILLLLVLNVNNWFHDPFSALQIVSWLVLIAAALLAAYGFYLLRAVGRPQGSFENTTTVVTVGAYRYIRHPLYTSLLLLAGGIFLKAPSLTGVILAALVAIGLVATARMEEQENLTRFGAAYAEYMAKTKMFIPWLW